MVSTNQGWCLHRTRMCLSEEKMIAGPNRITKCIRWRPKSIVAVPTTNGDGRPTPPYLSPIWTRLSFGRRSRISEWGGKSQMTALRYRITAHFPSFSATMAMSLACLSSACWVLVRSASRKILYVTMGVKSMEEYCGVESHPCMLKVRSFNSKLPWRKEMPI